jgi:hypothetical protein
VQGINAKFAFPRGITMGGAGDVLYLADTGNNCIRSVMLPSGHTQTFAGSSVKGLKDGVRDLAAPHAALSIGPPVGRDASCIAQRKRPLGPMGNVCELGSTRRPYGCPLDAKSDY